MNTQKAPSKMTKKSAAKKLPKNTAVLGAKTACKNRAKLRVSVAMANISMLYLLYTAIVLRISAADVF